MFRSLLVFCLLGMMTRAADFYVATNGSDAWSGGLDQPSAELDDGPFATLAKARDAVRALKSAAPDQPVTVQIRGGRYHLSETMVFGLADSGSEAGPITYEAFPKETPVFSSAIEIGVWKKLRKPPAELPKAARGKVWVADLPQLAEGAGELPQTFLSLFDEAGLLPRARTAGFIPVGPGNGRGYGKDKLVCPPGTIRDWPNPEDVELVVRPFHAWILNILPIASINPARQVVRTSLPATYTIDELHYLKGTPSCWFENVIDALDEPGEWVIDSRAGKLYLWPRQDGPPTYIQAPLLRELIRVEGEVDVAGPSDRPVTHLTFKGLSFMHGERYTLRPDDKGLQHDWEMLDRDNALLRLRGTEFCRIEDCLFTHSAGGAIRVDLHGQHNTIAGNHIKQIGGTGILLCGYGPGSKDVNHSNRVTNNHILDVGRIYSHSPGIFLWQSGENRVANNLVHHTPYSGIIVSGVMRDFFRRTDSRELVHTIRWHEISASPRELTDAQVQTLLHSHDNVIEDNEIHHVMQELGDGNGIYIRGAGPGNIIRRNYIHDLLSPIIMQSAIRTDGGQRDTLITENIIHRCRSHGIHLKLNNRAENNIIADILPAIHGGVERPSIFFKLREGPLTGGTILRNIMVHTEGKVSFLDQGNNPRLPAAWAHEANTDFNLYFSPTTPGLATAALKKSQEKGADKHSLVGDPGFVDLAKGTFALKPDSPALKLGFKAIDTSRIGLLKRR